MGPGSGPRHLVPKSCVNTRRSSVPFTEEQPGRFERDFVEIEEVGSGEFGKVIKVQSKSSDNEALYAIKKSKPFEGARHRYVSLSILLGCASSSFAACCHGVLI